MPRYRRSPVPALAIVAALIAAPAFAQGTDTTTSPPVTPPAASQPGASAASEPVPARVQEHIEELHRRLHITKAEEPQWQAFAQTMRDNAAHMDTLFKARADAADANAVADLQSYAAIAQAHAEDMQKLVPAFQALYSAMSPEQQKAADMAFRDFEHRRMARTGHS